jgi:acyl-CoA thioesterase
MGNLQRARRCAAVLMANDRSSQALGITVEIPQVGSAVASLRVRDDMVNGLDVMHGGLIFALADTAFAFACNAYDELTFAAGAEIEFLRPGRLGDELRATAREDYRGRRRAYYTVEVRNQRDDVIALFRGRSATSGEPLLK